jgi:uncharacterized protein
MNQNLDAAMGRGDSGARNPASAPANDSAGPAARAAAATPPAPDCIDTRQVPEEGRSSTDEKDRADSPLLLLGYLALGTYLGVLFMQGEVLSWFRIQEMFRFQAFHMYGVIGSAVAVGAVSLALIRRFDLRTVRGEPIRVPPKLWGDGRIPGARYWIGGTFFGLGWGLLGACPGPIFALLGSGVTVMVVGLGAALVGTWTYAALRDYLPH